MNPEPCTVQGLGPKPILVEGCLTPGLMHDKIRLR
jgi:hypothetical protein